MARKGDGIYRRGNVWRLDVRINGVRHPDHTANKWLTVTRF